MVKTSLFPSLNRTKSKLKKELKNSRKKRWWKGERLRSKFKEIDIYGEQIALTYKGESSFKTSPGAIMSLIVILMMLAFTAYKSMNFIQLNNPAVSK